MMNEARDLFTGKPEDHQGKAGSQPLASRMRPRSLDEFAGQSHILAPGRLLRRAIEADQLSSLIFSGPPGTGKTTLARIIAETTKSRFHSINAVLSGVKDIREAVDAAKQEKDYYDRRTILFIDEVHRWNKAQQDALLPWVENGTVILIGATTENPFFEVNAALVSRSRVFQLQQLEAGDLAQIMDQCLSDPVRGYGQFDVQIEADARDHLIAASRGDARSLLGAIELAVETSVQNFPPPAGTRIDISLETAEDSIQEKAILYDKQGDYHYDSISAFIKSLRGSDPDAALYWMARMIRGGESPRFIFRRMLISASEDVGLADPNALSVVESAARAFDRVGMPEGQFFLAQAALYLSTAPKSNSALGYFDALDAVNAEHKMEEVPNHLKDSNRDKHSFGHGSGYDYPHAFSEHWVAQQYLPANLRGRIFYQGGNLGFEADRYKTVIRRRELQLESGDDPYMEILSYSGPESDGGKLRQRWIDRSEGAVAQGWEQLRTRVFEELSRQGVLSRSSRVLVAGKDIGALMWESLRRCPEGITMARFLDQAEEERHRYLTAQANELEAPRILNASAQLDDDAPSPTEQLPWDILILHGSSDEIEQCYVWARESTPRGVEQGTPNSSGCIAILEKDPAAKPSLSDWYARTEGANSQIAERFELAEQDFFSASLTSSTPGPFEAPQVGSPSGPANSAKATQHSISIESQNLPSPSTVRRWFEADAYRQSLLKQLSNDELAELLQSIIGHLSSSAAKFGSNKTPKWRRWYRLRVFAVHA